MANCAHCGAPDADDEWELRPCSLKGRLLVAVLCRPCDEALNALVLAFCSVPGRRAAIRKYRARK